MQNIQLNGYNLLKEHWKGVSRLRIEQLRYIADIAETGSLTATAQRQFVSQQAISKTIKQLEKELDAVLLIRTRTGVTFTEIGKELVSFAQKVLMEEEEFQKHVNKIRNTERTMARNDMRIASTSAISNFILPILIANPKIQENNVTVHIDSLSRYEDVIEQVYNRKCDIGLITINETELSHVMAGYQNDLKAEIILKDKMIALMDRRYYTAESLAISPNFFSECKVRTMYNINPIEEFRRPVIDTNIIYSSDADFHRNMMEMAGAITLMSATTYFSSFNNKRYVPLMLDEGFNLHSLVHVVIYRTVAEDTMEGLINLLKREIILEGIKQK